MEVPYQLVVDHMLMYMDLLFGVTKDRTLWQQYNGITMVVVFIYMKVLSREERMGYLQTHYPIQNIQM